MTNAEIMQGMLLANMFKRLTDCSDGELMQTKQIAVELRDGKYIKAINNEMSRRVREQ